MEGLEMVEELCGHLKKRKCGQLMVHDIIGKFLPAFGMAIIHSYIVVL